MLSLANAFTAEELAAWEERNARIAARGPHGRLHRRDQDRRRRGEPHLRGRPADGRAPRAATASSARTSPPTSAPSPTCRSRSRGEAGRTLMEVRGEVYLPYAGFTRVNQAARARRASRSSPTRATPPPAGSGSSIPTLTRKRRLRMFAFAVEPVEGTARRRATHWELLDLLDALGLPGGAPPRALRRRWPRCRRRSPSFEAADPHAAVPGRRRGGQGRPARPARRAGRGRRPRAALGHRPEVRARGGGHPARRHPDQRGPHRRAQPLGRARAGRDHRA